MSDSQSWYSCSLIYARRLMKQGQHWFTVPTFLKFTENHFPNFVYSVIWEVHSSIAIIFSWLIQKSCICSINTAHNCSWPIKWSQLESTNPLHNDSMSRSSHSLALAMRVLHRYCLLSLKIPEIDLNNGRKEPVKWKVKLFTVRPALLWLPRRLLLLVLWPRARAVASC